MGQAKRRGTFEERKAEAIQEREREEAFRKQHEPVDETPGLFASSEDALSYLKKRRKHVLSAAMMASILAIDRP